MNTEFKQWVDETYPKGDWKSRYAVEAAYDHLKQNPHLLREDGEKEVITEVIAERKKQDAKWGEQNHSPSNWLAILGEEVGEANKAYLEFHFGPKTLVEYRSELIQVAAVAVAAIECLDRNSQPLNPTPRPTDMETEAENLLRNYVWHSVIIEDENITTHMVRVYDALTALTEFGEMCKQRGREEQAFINHDEHLRVCDMALELQQQLAEKELIINEWKQVWKPIDEEISKHPSLKLGDRKSLKVAEIIAELTAAKAEIERLKNELNDKTK